MDDLNFNNIGTDQATTSNTPADTTPVANPVGDTVTTDIPVTTPATPTVDMPIDGTTTPAEPVADTATPPVVSPTETTPTAPEETASPTQSNKWQSASDGEVLEADLLKELNLESSSKEEQDGLLARMTDVLQKSVINKLLESLDETKKTELDTILEKDDPEETLKFLQENTPNMDDIAKQELIRFKRAMLTGQV